MLVSFKHFLKMKASLFLQQYFKISSNDELLDIFLPLPRVRRSSNDEEEKLGDEDLEDYGRLYYYLHNPLTTSKCLLYENRPIKFHDFVHNSETSRELIACCQMIEDGGCINHTLKTLYIPLREIGTFL